MAAGQARRWCAGGDAPRAEVVRAGGVPAPAPAGQECLSLRDLRDARDAVELRDAAVAADGQD